MAICYLGVGTNLGNRRKNIAAAMKKINQLPDTRIIRVARIIETKPVGGPKSQPKFLNTALKIKTKLSPHLLLRKLKIIERELGRKKTSLRYGPRPIDLDILFYADRILNSKDLKIPHPKVFQREFVLRPLSELLDSRV
jgi:2-amino-4-hydroxy-6-hydroxymethyldihydropteridine diphosphokinase